MKHVGVLHVGVEFVRSGWFACPHAEARSIDAHRGISFRDARTLLRILMHAVVRTEQRVPDCAGSYERLLKLQSVFAPHPTGRRFCGGTLIQGRAALALGYDQRHLPGGSSVTGKKNAILVFPPSRSQVQSLYGFLATDGQ